jgi:acetyl-CoA carboxylase biotin carboxyl carrier protein
LDLNQLCELLAAINQTDIEELTLKSNDFELTVRRAARTVEPVYVSGATAQPVVEAAVAPLSAPTSLSSSTDSAPSSFTGQPTQAPPLKNDRRLFEINSPMVGTFYRAPAPNEPAFVEVGDQVRKGQTVCIIEAMKLMNEIESEVSGEVVEILLENGQPVEYGQPLIRVNPD